MSRRTSFGYSTYGSRSYHSGGYHRKRNRHGKMRILILTPVICLTVAGAAFSLWYFVLRNNRQPYQSTESSVVSEISSPVSEPSAEVSAQSRPESSVQVSSPRPDIQGYQDGNVFMYDRCGYELFYGTDESAAAYAAAVSAVKKGLGKDVNVYNMVVPNHAAFGLPEKYLRNMNDEKANIRTIYHSYSEDIIPIDVFDAEEKHKEEYTYFHTDHNWTALGAYYAYQEFCKTAKTNAIDLSTLTKGSIPSFKGSLFVATQTDDNAKGNKELLNNPDTVIYYHMPCIENCTLLENGKQSEQDVPLIASFAEGSNAYSAFIWGNNPYMRVKTTQKTGKKLCIIKDSYGCAFAPFVTANFDEVFIVDPSYYEGNVLDYLKKNKYTDVLVINSIMTANTAFRVSDILSILPQ